MSPTTALAPRRLLPLLFLIALMATALPRSLAAGAATTTSVPSGTPGTIAGPLPPLLRLPTRQATLLGTLTPSSSLPATATGQRGYPSPAVLSAPYQVRGPGPTAENALPIQNLPGAPAGANLSPATGVSPPLGIAKYAVPDNQAYATPSDSNVATDGTYAGYAYNAGNGEEIQFTDLLTGAAVTYYDMCGFSGFTGCSDIRLLYDRIGSADRWLLVYTIFTPNSDPDKAPGELALGVSNDGSPLDGFSIYGLGKLSGLTDAPRIGLSTDKVLLTGNVYSGGTEYARIYVANKGQLESLKGFSYDTIQGVNGSISLDPTTENDREQVYLSEAPDPSLPRPNGSPDVMALYEYSGPQGSLSITGHEWYIQNLPGAIVNASQPNTSVTLDTDGNKFNDSVIAESTLVSTANNKCVGTGGVYYPCAAFIGFDLDPFGTPVSVTIDGDLFASGVAYFYAALASTTLSNNLLGIVGYTDPSTGAYAGSVTIQMSLLTGGINGGPSVKGNSDILPSTGNVARWGDYFGCEQVPASFPSEAVCVGQYAKDGTEGVEGFVNEVQ